MVPPNIITHQNIYAYKQESMKITISVSIFLMISQWEIVIIKEMFTQSKI